MIYWRVFFFLFPVIVYSLISFLRMLFQLQPALDHLSTQHFSWTILTVLLPFTLLPDLRLSSEVVVAEFGVERRDTEAVLCLTIKFLEDFIDFTLFFKKNLLGCSCFKILCYFVQYSKVNQFSSIQSLSCVWLFVTPWTAAHQASLSISNSRSLLKLMSIELVMPSNHLIPCHPLLLLPSIFPSIRVFSNESVLHIRWPKY